ncbi:DUF1214 domain-containing protein [Hyphomicrobium sp.]|uniref:DUF1214 domain-containing protein n=1 Tax=Hyphomicrobium sp. TaxID=82 RepID=UPI002E338BD8|nr:DUF1214 domain-containing protein [Hyphomicrobium sp.]HEX2843328.1 DUF1214 domain-containing protein [Hyphomicrobium sp.]
MTASSALRSLTSLNFMSFTLHRLKKRIAAFVAYTTDWALFIGVVLILGLGSSWYMIERGSSLTTIEAGPWTSWVSAGRPDADPYTRAHQARLGLLPLSTENAQTFIARADSDGRTLHSSCDYAIEGREIPNFWWSLTVFDADGRLIPNVLGRSVFTSDTVAVKPDGSFVITLSRDANPGNWLPIGGAGRLALAFTAVDLGTRAVAQEAEIEDAAPTITRSGC